MVRNITNWAAPAAIAFTLVYTAGSGSAFAQDRRQNEVGQFDFYVLSLSWSPSFCAASEERGGDRPAPQQQSQQQQSQQQQSLQQQSLQQQSLQQQSLQQQSLQQQSPQQQSQQCGERPYSFVVHGLWPQYEKGFPEFCQVPAPRLDRNIVSSMLDMMPAPRLIFREWDRHGTCSGLSARAYFDNVRKARAVVKIPEEYLEPKAPREVTPDEVEDAFVKANPGLTRAAVAVSCDSKRLNEVRVCLSKEFHFRDCADVEQHTCRRDKLMMPPVRGS
jgi:ribonuclease T2